MLVVRLLQPVRVLFARDYIYYQMPRLTKHLRSMFGFRRKSRLFLRSIMLSRRHGGGSQAIFNQRKKRVFLRPQDAFFRSNFC